MVFADRLQTLRKGRGMSQETLAEALGVSRQAVSKWESGQSCPEVDKLIALSELFGVSLDRLVKESSAAEETTDGMGMTFNRYRFCGHYEYKSKMTLFNLPLVHINIGYGIHVAKGIIAIGNVAVGFLSLGGVAVGGLCLGGVSLGLIGFAGLAFCLLIAAGGIAVGTLAMGGLALGIFAMGGLAVGAFSVGGCAVASCVAVGGYASGHIAIGEFVKGARTLQIPHHQFSAVKAQQVRTLLKQEYPHLWKPVVDWITSFFS